MSLEKSKPRHSERRFSAKNPSSNFHRAYGGIPRFARNDSVGVFFANCKVCAAKTITPPTAQTSAENIFDLIEQRRVALRGTVFDGKRCAELFEQAALLAGQLGRSHHVNIH